MLPESKGLCACGGRAITNALRRAAMAAISSLVFTITLAPSYASCGYSPEHGGLQEDLLYRITWSGIPAGEAELKTIQGVKYINYQLTARSLPYLDIIYPVRIYEESTVSSGTRQPVRFYKKAREGLGRRENTAEVIFDMESGMAELRKDAEFKGRLPIPKDVHDPLSCLFWYRSKSGPGQDESLWITDGKKIIIGTAHVIKHEDIETPAGRFRTVLVEPKMEGLSGVFKKSPGARIMVWLTDDERKIPVMVKSKVIVGYFSAELIEIRRQETPSGK